MMIFGYQGVLQPYVVLVAAAGRYSHPRVTRLNAPATRDA